MYRALTNTINSYEFIFPNGVFNADIDHEVYEIYKIGTKKEMRNCKNLGGIPRPYTQRMVTINYAYYIARYDTITDGKLQIYCWSRGAHMPHKTIKIDAEGEYEYVDGRIVVGDKIFDLNID